MAELSKEQRHFCREVAKGRSPRAAYIAAFDCKESAASACASRMMRRANIQAEISRLRERGVQVAQQRLEEAREDGRDVRALWSKAERMEKVQCWAERAASDGRLDTALRGIDLLNRMEGTYDRQAEDAGKVQQGELRQLLLGRNSGWPRVVED